MDDILIDRDTIKQWGLVVGFLCRNYVHVGLMEQVNISSHEFIYIISFMSSTTWGNELFGWTNFAAPWIASA